MKKMTKLIRIFKKIFSLVHLDFISLKPKNEPNRTKKIKNLTKKTKPKPSPLESPKKPKKQYNFF